MIYDLKKKIVWGIYQKYVYILNRCTLLNVSRGLWIWAQTMGVLGETWCPLLGMWWNSKKAIPKWTHSGGRISQSGQGSDIQSKKTFQKCVDSYTIPVNVLASCRMQNRKSFFKYSVKLQWINLLSKRRNNCEYILRFCCKYMYPYL